MQIEFDKTSGRWVALDGDKVLFSSASKYYLQKKMREMSPKFVEAAKPSEFSINERFDFVGKIVKMVAAKTTASAIISGQGGLGKTYSVIKALEDAGMKNITDLADFQVGTLIDTKRSYRVVKGYSTAKGLFRTLQESNGCTIVFDDCDSVLLDDLSLNILKAALDSSKKRTISWNTDSRLLRSEGVPDRFDFKGGAIFITNLKFENVRSKKLQEHLAALESRCHYIDLRMDTDREKVLRIKQIVKDGMLDSYEIADEAKTEVVDFIEENRAKMRELSLRTVLKVADLRKSFPANWQNMARVTVMKGAY